MKTPPGPLRKARRNVLPLVPELATEIAANELVFVEAIDHSLSQQGFDPNVWTLGDRIKAAQGSVSGYLGQTVLDKLVDGRGPSAQIRNLPDRGIDIPSLALPQLRDDVLRRQTWAADETLDAFARAHGEAVLEGLKDNYSTLGERATAFVDPSARNAEHAVPDEALYLRDGLATPAYVEVMNQYPDLINGDGPSTAEQRRKAAHDLIHLPYAKASLHLQELFAGDTVSMLGVTIYEADGGYIASQPSREARREVYPHLDDIQLAKLGCPMTAFSGHRTMSPITDGPTLRDAAHAFVNAAYAACVFGNASE